MTDEKAPKAKSAKVGVPIEVADPASVVRPSGEPVTVTGGLFVPQLAGTYLVDGVELEVKG